AERAAGPSCRQRVEPLGRELVLFLRFGRAAAPGGGCLNRSVREADNAGERRSSPEKNDPSPQQSAIVRRRMGECKTSPSATSSSACGSESTPTSSSTPSTAPTS